MTGAERIAGFLREKGVRTAFGYPGANIIELYDALSDGSVQNIICRHEQGAIHAAVGYAKTCGRPGVCLATSGPGAANLMTGIADANLDSTPLVVITGQVPGRFIGRDAFQEADVLGMTIPITKHNYLVRESSELSATLEEAWELASSGRRGPVLIDIARNVFTEEVPEAQAPLREARPCAASEFPLDGIWDKLIPALERSSRPLILAGGGVVADGADSALADFAAASGIPLAVTLMARGSMAGSAVGVDFLGFAGRCGHAAACRALAECDLLIASGTRFSERTVGDFDAFKRRFILHNDIDPAEISKNIRADAAAVCPAGEFFRALSSRLELRPERYAAWREELDAVRETENDADDTGTLTMRSVCRALGSVLSARRDSIVITDVGENQMAAAAELSPTVARGFITSGGLGTMGFGLPGAVGAAFAVSDWRNGTNTSDGGISFITAVMGDGGFQMTEQELSTVAFSPIPIKMILLDNGGLGMLRSDRRNQSFTLYGNPDFEALVKAYGFPAETVDTPDDLTSRIGSFLAAPCSGMLRFSVK